MSIKNFFALLFIISLSVFLFFKFYPTTIEEKHTQIDKKVQINQKPHLPSLSVEANIEGTEDSFILLTSLITSLLSFIGFLISSYFSLKGHRRDEELFNLQKERERLEMEKIQAEIRALAESK
jgi:hypothetical protein